MILGLKTKILKEHPFPNQTCPACKSNNSSIVAVCEYLHIAFIPVFPNKKKTLIACNDCGHTTYPMLKSAEIGKLGDQLQAAVKYPFYMFTGTALFALLVISQIISSHNADLRTQEYLETPQVNDIYFLYNEYEPTEYKYSLSKAQRISEDSIYVTYSSFSYNMKPDKLDPEDGFYDISLPLHKDYLKEIYETGELLSIQRGYDHASGYGRTLEMSDEDLQELLKVMAGLDSLSTNN